MKCRHCNNKLKYEFLDLGVSAPSNSFIKKENLNLPEKSFPLRVMVCDTCWLVQTEDFVNASEMFTHEYAYFSSYSSSFLNHTKEYVDKMVSKFSLDENSSVLEDIEYYLENIDNNLFLHLGEDSHKIKKKAEQSACLKAIHALENKL